MQVRDLRNVRHAALDLAPGLNVLVGRNAQGKTSLLEAIGLLARGRSFRTEDVRAVVRKGSEGLHAEAVTHGTGGRETRLAVGVGPGPRQLFVDGREVRPRDYHGRLEVVVYGTERLRIVRGPMKERRLFLDRAAGALWPSYRQLARDYERILSQRNAALEEGGRGLEPWDERFVAVGAVLRQRRARYVQRLRGLLAGRENPAREIYDVVLPEPHEDEAAEKARLAREIGERRRDELRVRHSLVGPHRDEVGLTVNGEEVAVAGSSGQARSVLLALCLAMLDLHREETGESAVALLDDLDSELDEDRATALCHEVVRGGQAVVTTAHPAWARRLADAGRVFEVEDGAVRAA